jgi:hypothetical protein
MLFKVIVGFDYYKDYYLQLASPPREIYYVGEIMKLKNITPTTSSESPEIYSRYIEILNSLNEFKKEHIATYLIKPPIVYPNDKFVDNIWSNLNHHLVIIIRNYIIQYFAVQPVPTPTTTTIITTIAGNAISATGGDSWGFSGDGLHPSQSRLNKPMGILVNGNNEIIFCDVDNNRIRKISNDTIQTIAGGETDITNPNQLSAPIGITLDIGCC